MIRHRIPVTDVGRGMIRDLASDLNPGPLVDMVLREVWPNRIRPTDPFTPSSRINVFLATDYTATKPFVLGSILDAALQAFAHRRHTVLRSNGCHREEIAFRLPKNLLDEHARVAWSQGERIGESRSVLIERALLKVEATLREIDPATEDVSAVVDEKLFDRVATLARHKRVKFDTLLVEEFRRML